MGADYLVIGSPGRARTADMVINSHPLYQLSYRGLHNVGIIIRIIPLLEYTLGYLEKLASLVFRGTLRGLSIGEMVINQRLTLQLIRSIPPNPHPVEVFRGAL